MEMIPRHATRLPHPSRPRHPPHAIRRHSKYRQHAAANAVLPLKNVRRRVKVVLHAAHNPTEAMVTSSRRFEMARRKRREDSR